jgi:hypothetical protein
MSPVMRLVPDGRLATGVESAVWLHDGTRVRPSFVRAQQLRCRGAACEGGAEEPDAFTRSCNSLETHRTLISAGGASMLVARASSCSCHRRCILPSASPTAAGVHVTTGNRTRTRTGTTGSSLRLLTRGFQLGMRTGRAHKREVAPRHFCAATQRRQLTQGQKMLAAALRAPPGAPAVRGREDPHAVTPRKRQRFDADRQDHPPIP